jgi:acyl-CoA synthetase (NDP forming)/RimJ/RimL family protein N-acetyltransferase
MSTRNLEWLFRPRSVAVLDAAPDAIDLGGTLVRKLLAGGFQGPIFPLNPIEAEIGGLQTYGQPAELPEAPDLALICGPAEHVPVAIQAFGALGTRAAIVFSSGTGAGTREAILAAAGAHNLRVLGPDSAGVFVPELGLHAGVTYAPPPPGDVAFVSQSAAMFAAAVESSRSGGSGFSCVVSLGNAADVDAADLLDHFSADPGTRAIGLHLESIGQARKFMSAARSAARAKPVVVVKSGSSPQGASAIAGRTEEPVSRDDLFDSLVHRAGLLRVRTGRELFAAIATVSRPGIAENAELLILTNDSGAGTLAVDALVHHGHRVASIPRDVEARIRTIRGLASVRNPVDIGRDAPVARYATVLGTLLDTRAPYVVLLIHVPSAAVTPRDVAIACASIIAKPRHPVLACWIGTSRSATDALRAQGARCYETPEEAVEAFAQLALLASNQRALLEVASAPTHRSRPERATAKRIVTRALADGRSNLSETETKGLLMAYGVPVLETRHTGDTSNAFDVATTLRLALVDDALFGPTIELEPYGRSNASDGRHTADFAPMTFGLARDMLMRARFRSASDGGAGHPSGDTDTLCRAIVQLSKLGAELREIARLELQPLYVEDGSVVAGEVRCALSRSGEGVPSAIAPYPAALEQQVKLRGIDVMLRPIRPDDAHAYAELICATDPAHLRYRFARLPRDIVAPEVARYTQVDYDREMAFVATPVMRSDGPEILGEVRMSVYRRSGTAEFSILVRSDMHRTGIGRALLNKMIDYCAARGLSELIGQIRAENEPMIALARSVGMDVREAPGSSIAVAHLDLKALLGPG